MDAPTGCLPSPRGLEASTYGIVSQATSSRRFIEMANTNHHTRRVRAIKNLMTLPCVPRGNNELAATAACVDPSTACTVTLETCSSIVLGVEIVGMCRAGDNAW